MRVLYHRKFRKHFEKLTYKLQGKTIEAVELFRRNPFNLLLRNHALSGKMSGKRAISVTGDMRIVFEEYDGYVLVVMLDVGTHGQVYG